MAVKEVGQLCKWSACQKWSWLTNESSHTLVVHHLWWVCLIYAVTTPNRQCPDGTQMASITTCEYILAVLAETNHLLGLAKDKALWFS